MFHSSEVISILSRRRLSYDIWNPLSNDLAKNNFNFQDKNKKYMYMTKYQ